MYRSKFNSRKHPIQPPKKQHLARNQKHNGTNSHLSASLIKTFYLLPAIQNWCHLHFFFCQQSYQSSFDIYWCWCRKYKQPTEIFLSQTQFTAQASKLIKTSFSSLWQIQLPPDSWYFPSPMISAFSTGGHHVPQSKGLIQSTNVRYCRLSCSALEDFLTVSVRKHSKIHSVQGLKILWALFWELRNKNEQKYQISYSRWNVLLLIHTLMVQKPSNYSDSLNSYWSKCGKYCKKCCFFFFFNYAE